MLFQYSHFDIRAVTVFHVIMVKTYFGIRFSISKLIFNAQFAIRIRTVTVFKLLWLKTFFGIQTVGENDTTLYIKSEF